MKYAKLTLTGSYHETSPQASGFQGSGRFQFDRFLLAVEKILDSPRIERVLIDCRNDFSPRLFGGAEAVREQIRRLTESGKETYFYAREYDALRLYLASSARYRRMHPLGTFSFLGLARPFLFFRNLLDRNKVDPQVIRRGKYKSAADRLEKETLDPANEEQYTAYLTDVEGAMSRAIEEGLNKSGEELRDLRNGTMLTAEAAKEEGWVDEVGTLSQLLREWKEDKVKERKLKKLGKGYGSGRKKLAILFFEGSIVDGKTRRHPLLGQSIGDASFVAEVKKLAEDKSIKGVVLRINSGGGSATASEEILSSLRELSAKKPVVVSMSEIAGSGGYWIALEGARIFAENTTLTGSIGVVTLSLTVQKLLKKHGITSATLRTAPHADLGSALRKMTKEERRLIEETVDELYEKFVDTVAAARGRTREEILAVAEGRVWSGTGAATNGLVDEIGGIHNALAYLRGAAGLKKSKVLLYPETKRSIIGKLIARNTPLGAAISGELPFLGRFIAPGSWAGGDLLNGGLPFSGTTPQLLTGELLEQALLGDYLIPRS